PRCESHLPAGYLRYGPADLWPSGRSAAGALRPPHAHVAGAASRLARSRRAGPADHRRDTRAQSRVGVVDGWAAPARVDFIADDLQSRLYRRPAAAGSSLHPRPRPVADAIQGGLEDRRI